MKLCDRQECRNDVYVAVCAARSGSAGTYTRAEHDAALDRLLADLELVDPAPGHATPDARCDAPVVETKAQQAVTRPTLALTGA